METPARADCPTGNRVNMFDSWPTGKQPLGSAGNVEPPKLVVFKLVVFKLVLVWLDRFKRPSSF